MRNLLNSNICVDCLRKTGRRALYEKLARVPAHEIAVCSVVVAELSEGCHRSQKVQENLQATRSLLAFFHSYPFDDAAAEHAATVGAALLKGGERIEQNDLFIAAVALSQNLTLVTHNRAHFSRIPTLRVDDWQAE